MSRDYPARPIASAAAVVLRGDDVLLIRRGQPPGKGIWTYPGGAIETGETAREACAREVLEETGLHVHVGPVIEAVDIMEPDGNRWRHHYIVLDFLAEMLDRTERLSPGSDAIEAVWAPIQGLDQYDLTPLARQVLERAQWMWANGGGPLMQQGAKAITGHAKCTG